MMRTWYFYLLIIVMFWLTNGESAAAIDSPPAYIELTLGKASDIYTTSCDNYTYFRISVTEACKDMQVLVDRLEGEPDLYVSKWPNKYPTFRSLAWSSYDWGTENFTILSTDPDFSIGTYTIGVHAYCGIDVISKYTAAKYTVTVQLVSPSSAEFLQLNQSYIGTVYAKQYLHDKFCIPDNCTNVHVQLKNCIGATQCPYTYAWPELIISSTKKEPTLQDRTWKLASSTNRNITLNYKQVGVGPGPYYFSVYGWCTPNEFCTDKSTCGPCENYRNGIYFTITVTASAVPPEICETRN